MTKNDKLIIEFLKGNFEIKRLSHYGKYTFSFQETYKGRGKHLFIYFRNGGICDQITLDVTNGILYMECYEGASIKGCLTPTQEKFFVNVAKELNKPIVTNSRDVYYLVYEFAKAGLEFKEYWD